MQIALTNGHTRINLYCFKRHIRLNFIASMLILAIETSCDETALAIVKASGNLKTGPGFEVIKEVVSSQIAIHRPFGGVVPNLAKREHIKNLPILLKKLLDSNFQLLNSIDAIAVTVGPGLEPALWAGITFAQKLAHEHKKPLIGVNHLEGHLYSFLLPQGQKRIMNNELGIKGKKKIYNPTPNSQFLIPNSSSIFPAVALIVSGGHTVLLLLKNLKSWKRLGETRDDAVGEAFDKVARVLKLPYPGGPEIQKLVEKLPKGWKDKINFPRPMIGTKDYDFSFSGLKTSVLYYVRDHKKYSKTDVASSFSNAAIDVLSKKTMRAASDFNAQSILLSGGVAANKMLREKLSKKAKEGGIKFFVAEHKYNTDNAVMIAVAGYMNILRKKRYKMEADGMLNI